jgi:hypothetical protein
MNALFHARLRHSGGLLPQHRAQATQLLVNPRRIGQVGEIYHDTSTGLHRARVYWSIRGQWYAVNVPLGHLEPC